MAFPRFLFRGIARNRRFGGPREVVARGGMTVEDIEKLKRLLPHWREHNADHGRSYAEWAGRARRAGSEDVAKVLERIARASDDLDGLFREAEARLGTD